MAEKKQRRHYSGKKKRHTQKTQLIVNQKTEEILATAFAHGSQHDFELFKESRCQFSEQIRILADSGYLGLAIYMRTAKFRPRNRSFIH